MAAAWEMTHSVETDAPPDAAWKYWTNIENWIDPPAEFELDGPFVEGACGITRIPGQPPLHWVIREMHAPETATIETQLDGARLSFAWRFAGLSDGRSRLTQHVELWGENAEVSARGHEEDRRSDGSCRTLTSLAGHRIEQGDQGWLVESAGLADSVEE